MKEMLEKIDEKLDKIHENITEVKIDVAKNTVSLDHHIKRTDELQDLYEKLEADNIRVKMIWKVVLGMSVLVGMIGTIYKMMG